MAKVSIVVPVYNVARQMRETMQALREQTLKDIEIILVDDGSTDESGRICDELAAEDGRFVVIHTENRGVCAARNTGIAAAGGEYIGFCDSDDMPDEDMYETLLDLICTNNTDMAMVQSMVVYEDGSTFSVAKNSGLHLYEDNSELIKKFLMGRFGTAVYKMLFKAELAKSVSFEEGRKINEDKMFVFEAMRRVKSACYLDKNKYRYYRRYGSSSFSEFSEKYFDGIYFSEKINKAVREEFPEILPYSDADLARTHLWTLKLMVLENGRDKFRKEYDASVRYLRGLDAKFCKRYLDRNNYIKWRALKLGTPLYKLVTKIFSKN